MNLTLSIIWLVSVGLGYYLGFGRGYRHGRAVAVSIAVVDLFKKKDDK